MIPKEKSRMNLKILDMLRSKGAPAVSPFPGEQDFESMDVDLDQMGDVLLAKGKPEPKATEEQPKKKKKKPQMPARTPEEQEEALKFVPADESVQMGGVN